MGHQSESCTELGLERGAEIMNLFCALHTFYVLGFSQ